RPEIIDEELIIGYQAQDSSGEDTYYVFVNGDDQQRALTLDEDLTEGIVIVDGEEAGAAEITNPTGVTLAKDKITIDPLTAIVIKVGHVQSDEDEEEPDDNGEDPDNGKTEDDDDKPKDDDKTPEKDEKESKEENDEQSDVDGQTSDNDEDSTINDQDQDGKGLPK